jgi:ATP-dependent Clp protease adaptor protein ClpS
MPKEQKDAGTGIAVKERQETKYKKPRMHKVIFYNDDYTPFDFVTMLLQTIYNKTEQQSLELAMEIHKKGSGIAGIYTREIAETKIVQSNTLIIQKEYPLIIEMEPE